MTAYQTLEMKDIEVSSDIGDDDDAIMIEILDNCGTNDDGHATEELREEEGDVLYEHEYEKNKAVEQLSAVFELLKIEPVHDKYVANLLLIFWNDSCV